MKKETIVVALLVVLVLVLAVQAFQLVGLNSQVQSGSIKTTGQAAAPTSSPKASTPTASGGMVGGC